MDADTIRDLFANFGPVDIRRMFGGVGVFVDGIMIAIVTRDGSERIYVGNRLLTRDVDYTVDYTTGQVQFRNADSLFQGGATQVRAQFEERAAFAVAPFVTQAVRPAGPEGGPVPLGRDLALMLDAGSRCAAAPRH